MFKSFDQVQLNWLNIHNIYCYIGLVYLKTSFSEFSLKNFQGCIAVQLSKIIGIVVSHYPNGEGGI